MLTAFLSYIGSHYCKSNATACFECMLILIFKVEIEKDLTEMRSSQWWLLWWGEIEQCLIICEIKLYKHTAGNPQKYVFHYSGAWVSLLVITIFSGTFLKGLIWDKKKRKTIEKEKEEKHIQLRKFTPIMYFIFSGTTGKKFSNSKFSGIHHRKSML